MYPKRIMLMMGRQSRVLEIQDGRTIQATWYGMIWNRLVYCRTDKENGDRGADREVR